ncbi:hypothetical protein J6590_023102 [Homalodisca vitripennis]|nr:hypothetical protein J6590_023102 [Homalodisca vitripennis]
MSTQLKWTRCPDLKYDCLNKKGRALATYRTEGWAGAAAHTAWRGCLPWRSRG